MAQGNVQRNIRVNRELDQAFVAYCKAANRRPNDVISQCLRMLLEGGHSASEARLTALLHGYREWPDPRAVGAKLITDG